MVLATAPGHPDHVAVIRGSHYIAGRARTIVFAGVEDKYTEMEIDWMTGDELSQAIPPVYSRYLAQFIPVNQVHCA